MKHLVVGMDGSPDAEAALTWAEVAAGSTGSIHSVQATTGEDPTEVLLRAVEAMGADAVVVGAHGRSAVVPRTIGSVAAHLLPRSPVPVVVVRRDAVCPLGSEGTVVVGIGRGPATQSALRWAATFAAERGMALSLVRATGTKRWFDEQGLLDVLAYYLDPSAVRDWAAEDLAELAAELEQSEDGTLRVSWTATSGRAGPRLVEAAADAALLVIGRHPEADHVAVGPLHHALLHAPCPVVMVPVGDG